MNISPNCFNIFNIQCIIKLGSEIMKVIINRIEIHQDKQVDLYFNFKQLNNLKEKI